MIAADPPGQVGAAEAIQSMIKIASYAFVEPYVQFVSMGLLDHAAASAKMNDLAATIDRMDLPAPQLGRVVADAVREYAAAVAGRPKEASPVLRLVGAGDGGAEPR
jgi:hypothetical protein